MKSNNETPETEFAHTKEDLIRFQSESLEDKIQRSLAKISEWYMWWDNEVYVSFSGGIDSTVLADLCARWCKIIGKTLYLCFVNTGLEYPQIQKFVPEFAEWLRTEYKIEVVLDIIRPTMRFDEVIKKYGYPVASKEIANNIQYAKKDILSGNFNTTRVKKVKGELLQKDGTLSAYNCSKWAFLLDAPFDVSSQCCSAMKKKPFYDYSKKTGRKPIVGIMANESRLRTQRWLYSGCNAFEGKSATSAPLSFWLKQDILHYLKEFEVPYCSVYGDIVIDLKDDQSGQLNIIDYLGEYERDDILKTTGCERTGCIFCMFGCHLEKKPNRFQRLKETHPRQYEYCIGGGEMIDGKWQPNKEGLGLGKVLDFIGVKYD